MKKARKKTVKQDFDKEAATSDNDFTVDIRAIHDPANVLQTLCFKTREEFCDFARNENIRPDGYYDLCGKDLSGMNLSGAHFIIADLTFANLTDAKLVDADLLGANLTSAMLRRADLTGAETATAQVHGDDLAHTGMTEDQLYVTFGTPAYLPSGASTRPEKKKKKDGPFW